MGSSVTSWRALKSVHKVESQTQRERLHVFDEDEAVILGVALADDACFQAKAAKIAADPENRLVVARAEARDYAPYRGPHHETMAGLLLLAAAAPWERFVRSPDSLDAGRRTSFANAGRSAVWAESDAGDADARRARERWERLREGARSVCRFGAGRCIRCAKVLDGGGRGYNGARRTHCRACEECEEKLPKKIRASEREAMRDVLDAASGHRRTRRARRRAANSGRHRAREPGRAQGGE